MHLDPNRPDNFLTAEVPTISITPTGALSYYPAPGQVSAARGCSDVLARERSKLFWENLEPLREPRPTQKNAGRLPGDFFHSFSAGAEKL